MCLHIMHLFRHDGQIHLFMLIKFAIRYQHSILVCLYSKEDMVDYISLNHRHVQSNKEKLDLFLTIRLEVVTHVIKREKNIRGNTGVTVPLSRCMISQTRDMHCLTTV